MPNDSAILALLPTLDDLSKFWTEHRESLPFAACLLASRPGGRHMWVFGTSKSKAVELALDWSKWQPTCTWRPASADERELAGVDESTTYGFWEFANLPFGISEHSWFSEPVDLTDPNMNPAEVMQLFKEQTFDAWGQGGAPVCFLDSEKMDEEVQYWLNERAAGEEYYGAENERSAR